MKIKNLAMILITLAGLNGGCSKLEYNLPNEEKAIFGKDYLSKRQVLTIEKSDGRVITYWDYSLDGEVDRVEITKDGKTKKYNQSEVLAEAQKQFDKYVSEIESKEIDDALNDLK